MRYFWSRLILSSLVYLLATFVFGEMLFSGPVPARALQPQPRLLSSNPRPGSYCQDVSWSQVANLAVQGSTVQKTGGLDGSWDAGAVSVNAIRSGNGFVQVTVDSIDTDRAFGLSNGNSDSSLADIDYAAYLAHNTLWIYRSGVSLGTFGVLNTGDTVRVSVENGTVRYYLNSNLVYESMNGLLLGYPLL